MPRWGSLAVVGWRGNARLGAHFAGAAGGCPGVLLGCGLFLEFDGLIRFGDTVSERIFEFGFACPGRLFGRHASAPERGFVSFGRLFELAKHDVEEVEFRSLILEEFLKQEPSFLKILGMVENLFREITEKDFSPLLKYVHRKLVAILRLRSILGHSGFEPSIFVGEVSHAVRNRRRVHEMSIRLSSLWYTNPGG